MDYKQYFKDLNLIDLASFFDYTHSQFHYGWMDQEHNYHKGINDGKTFSLQTPIELMNSHIGNCWDMTELYRCWFQHMTSFRYETYYIFYDDGLGCPSHSIFVFYDQDQVFWFEPTFLKLKLSGIHRFHTIEELLNYAKDAFIQNSIMDELIPVHYDEKKIYLYCYQQPKFHINGFQMRNHIDQSKFIA